MTATPSAGVALARASSPPPLLPDGVLVAYDGLHIELLAQGASRHPARLDLIRDDVLDVAARSRGWEEPDRIEDFCRVFKFGSLYRADALALVWSGGHVVGLAGAIRERGPDGAVILHVCSLGLLPWAQHRGYLSTLFALLWDLQDAWPGTREAYRRGQVYLSAVTQSPLIMSFLGRVSDLYPAPGRTVDPQVRRIAQHVIARFEPEVTLDPETFVLRNEAPFGYHRIPYSADARLNDYCDERLRYDEGDTFLLVGRLRRDAVRAFVRDVAGTHEQLFATTRSALVAAHPSLTWQAP